MKEKDFGIYISNLRLKRGYESQRQLALAAGLSPSTMLRIENGSQKATPETLKKLAPILGVNYEELMLAAGYISASMIKESEVPYSLPKDVISIGETRKVPVIGTIRCGEPIYAFEDIQEWVDVPISELNGAEYFFLTVTGDSMTGSNIYPGYRVLIRRQDMVDNGQVAVVITKSCEATLKRIKFLEEAVILYPDNPKYQPQIYKTSEVRIIGRVVKVEFKL